MRISILTLFPQMFGEVFSHSLIKRAIDSQILQIDLVNPRDYTSDKYKTVDDRPYGGGRGMLLKVDVIDRALEAVKKSSPVKTSLSILLDPKGQQLNQNLVTKFSKIQHLILVCGHYEGVDSRVAKLVDKTISVGPYILSGGEIAAMLVVDAITRLIPGVLSVAAVENESFVKNTYEPPQYTRPRLYRNLKVPQVLLSGNHLQIAAWKSKMSQPIKKSLIKSRSK